ncbi:glycosyltransferase family 2 protein [Terriglobus saanensis]|uniref:glycosyltransferase family 2 protein n=1 Tax=Terriglobus saanensis TaxID=870903 RepID=UPI00315D24B7
MRPVRNLRLRRPLYERYGGRLRPAVIILTFNSAETIATTLRSVRSLTDEIILVDSGSTDETIQLATELGAFVVSHPFENYGAQRNWAIDNLEITKTWQLHLDADEDVSEDLAREIEAIPESTAMDGFLVARYLKFMGRVLRHNLAPTYHMRLFRSGKGRCEARMYDQHFICSGPIGTLKHSMVDDIRMPLTEWTRRHNQWADAEVKELRMKRANAEIQGRWFGNKIQVKRRLRQCYENLPLFVRPGILFIYRYILTGGFLDGHEGLIFCVLQTFWFRFLIDAKLFEADRQSATK